MQLVVNHTGGGNVFARQKLSDHIHHLVYKSGRQKGGSSVEELTEQGQVAETFHYQCSHFSCSAMVSLRILSPLINPKFAYLLTDPEAIRQRAEEAIAAEPERLEGMAKPLPINVLENLRLYLTNALHNSTLSKAITPNNKRFMISFGVEGAACKELLEFLGFENRKVCNVHFCFWLTYSPLTTISGSGLAASSSEPQSGHSLPRRTLRLSRRRHTRNLVFNRPSARI